MVNELFILGKDSVNSKDSNKISRIESKSTSKLETNRSDLEKTKLSPRESKNGYNSDTEDIKDSFYNSIKLQAKVTNNSNIASGKNLKDTNSIKTIDK